jgi:hypothetical protein
MDSHHHRLRPTFSSHAGGRVGKEPPGNQEVILVIHG